MWLYHKVIPWHLRESKKPQVAYWGRKTHKESRRAVFGIHWTDPAVAVSCCPFPTPITNHIKHVHKCYGRQQRYPTSGMAVQRTVSRRIDVLLLQSPAGTPIPAVGWAPECPSPSAAACSDSSERLWRREPQQCARPAGTAAARGARWSASLRNLGSCAAAVTGTSSGREQMRRGTNCWHLVCASGTGPAAGQQERGDFILGLLESLGRNGSSASLGKDTAHTEWLSPEIDNSESLLLFSFTCK